MAGSDSLTDEEREAFAATRARYGLGAAKLSTAPILSTADYGGRLVFSPSEELSSIPPMHIPYNSMAELKAMIGRPDRHFTSGKMSHKAFAVPEPLNAERMALLSAAENDCDFDFNITRVEASALHKAAQTYVYGNSETVKSYEPLLNLRFAPSSVALFAGKDLIVKEGEKLHIKPDENDPTKIVAVNYEAITVEEGGQIIVEAHVHMDTGVFTAV